MKFFGSFKDADKVPAPKEDADHAVVYRPEYGKWEAWVAEWNGTLRRQDWVYVGSGTQAEMLEMVEDLAMDNPRRRRSTKCKATCKAKRNPSGKSGVILGTLDFLEVLRPNGNVTKVGAKGRLLGWLPGSKTLCILNSKRLAKAEVSSGIAGVHKRFHKVQPTGAHVFEWPDPQGRKVDIGRIVALQYSIPSWLKSPGKAQYKWHHEFGDHGERGHGPTGERGNYPVSLMPMLQEDQAGNLYIKRMPGNKFYVTDWLYW